MSHEFEVGVFNNSSWHKLENEVGPIPNIEESLVKYGADYEVHKLPIGITLPDGGFFNDEGRFGILRPPTTFDPEWRRLRIVGDRYEAIQNVELARILQPLADSGWPTVGWAVLKQGQIFFIQLKVDEWTVGGQDEELHKSYLLVSNDHTQGNAWYGNVSTRVVCANTHAQAIGEGIEAIPHNASTSLELDYRSKIQQAILRAQANEREALNAFFKTKIDNAQLEAGLKEIFPDPVPSRKMKLLAQGEAVGVKEHDFVAVASGDYEVFNQKVERAGDLRNATRLAFGQFNEQHSYAGNTAYALFQAVTNVTNHSSLFTGSAEKNLVSLHFGNKAKINETAWQVASQLSK